MAVFCGGQVYGPLLLCYNHLCHCFYDQIYSRSKITFSLLLRATLSPFHMWPAHLSHSTFLCSPPILASQIWFKGKNTSRVTFSNMGARMWFTLNHIIYCIQMKDVHQVCQKEDKSDRKIFPNFYAQRPPLLMIMKINACRFTSLVAPFWQGPLEAQL